MKKVLFLLLMVAAFVACSKDDDNKKDELEFIQVMVTTDDGVSPEGIVSLFYLDKGALKECPNFMERGGSKMVYATRDDGETIFPVSKLDGDKMISSSKEKGASVCSFFWEKLGSALYGVPQAGGRYVVFIQLSSHQEQRAYKEFTIDENKRISVHLPSSNILKECVDATWEIKKYDGD